MKPVSGLGVSLLLWVGLFLDMARTEVVVTPDLLTVVVVASSMTKVTMMRKQSITKEEVEITRISGDEPAWLG